ncbi:MAG: PilZ domain-containing protein [Thermoanaerobaculia bacterium]
MSPEPSRRERRLRRRHALDDVRGNLLFSYECSVLDLSPRGMAVRTSTALAPGRSYAVKLEHEGRALSLSGTVAWCRLQGTRQNEKGERVPVYAAGIELGGDPSEKARELLPLLEKRGLIQLERCLAGRLAPLGRSGASGGPSDGGEPATVTVRRLSRTGMVVEAPFFPERGELLELGVDLEERPLVMTVRTTAARPLDERDGRPWAEITVDYAEMSPDDREALDHLIRQELGLGNQEGE